MGTSDLAPPSMSPHPAPIGVPSEPRPSQHPVERVQQHSHPRDRRNEAHRFPRETPQLVEVQSAVFLDRLHEPAPQLTVDVAFAFRHPETLILDQALHAQHHQNTRWPPCALPHPADPDAHEMRKKDFEPICLLLQPVPRLTQHPLVVVARTVWPGHRRR